MDTLAAGAGSSPCACACARGTPLPVATGALLQAPAAALRSKCQAALAGSIASAGPGAAVEVGSTLCQLCGQRRLRLRLILSYRACVGVREWEGWGAEAR